jgi:Fungal Zn(2)-Cys(6) binuclear cluster domain
MTAAPSQRKRRRPALSCVECRRRKIKCDRNIPCGPCKQTKSATCTYSPEGRGLARKSHGEATNTTHTAPSESSDTLTGALAESIFGFDELDHLDGSQPDHLSNEHRSASPGHSTPSNRDRQDAQKLLDRIQRLEATLGEVSISSKSKPKKAPKEPAKELRGNLVKTRWFGPSHWMQAFAQVC